MVKGNFSFGAILWLAISRSQLMYERCLGQASAKKIYFTMLRCCATAEAIKKVLQANLNVVNVGSIAAASLT